MNLKEFKNDCETIKFCAAYGSKIISSLEDYLEKEFGEHFLISNNDQNQNLLEVAFYGMQLRFRIEITSTENAINGFIRSYHIPYGDPKVENLLASVEYGTDGKFYDEKGNLMKEELGDYFLDRIFPSGKHLNLRPIH